MLYSKSLSKALLLIKVDLLVKTAPKYRIPVRSKYFLLYKFPPQIFDIEFLASALSVILINIKFLHLFFIFICCFLYFLKLAVQRLKQIFNLLIYFFFFFNFFFFMQFFFFAEFSLFK